MGLRPRLAYFPVIIRFFSGGTRARLIRGDRLIYIRLNISLVSSAFGRGNRAQETTQPGISGESPEFDVNV